MILHNDALESKIGWELVCSMRNGDAVSLCLAVGLGSL